MKAWILENARSFNGRPRLNLAILVAYGIGALLILAVGISLTSAGDSDTKAITGWILIGLSVLKLVGIVFMIWASRRPFWEDDEMGGGTH